MADEDDQDDGGAARAFAELRAEVAATRRTVVETLAPPDYAPSLRHRQGARRG
jgi:hypothetical protein